MPIPEQDKSGPFRKPILDEIHTSLFIPESGRDLRIVIRPPSIEYSMSAKEFLFIKNLTYSELEQLIDCSFVEWENIAIKCLQA